MPATALEQMILELVNRARLDPAAESARYGIALNEGVPPGDTISTASKQPLAMNETLLGTARAHSQDMIDRDYFAHDTPEGVTPFQRMTNAGYNFTTAGENIALVTSSNPLTNQSTIDLHQFLFVDSSVPGRGHRVNILLGDYQEIGVGQAAGDFQGSNGSALTEDFGTRGNQQFLTGVSYADADHDNFYSIGEGRGSMSVTAGGSTSTGAAGGYSLAVGSGVQTVTFSNGGLASPINVSVSIAANTNAKVDVIDQGTIATSVSLTDLGGATKIIGLGTFGLTLTGDSGNDIFIGTKGNDTIDGAGGSDTVVFSGNASAYTRTTLGNGSIPVAGPDGTDTLSNVEVLQFADQSISVGGSPDLTASSAVLDRAGLSYRINNTGTGAAAASTAGIYLSTDGTITTSDTLLITHATPALAGGASDLEAASVPFPNNLTPGTYFVGVIADHNGQIAESNETNNASSGIPVILGNDSANTLNGTTGNDTIVGFGGDDTINGGAGDDTAVFVLSVLAGYTLQNLGNRVLVSGPEGSDTVVATEHLQFGDGTINYNDGDPLIDAIFYERNNLDVFHAGVDAKAHYDVNGWHEARDPNPFFSTGGYLSFNADVKAAAINPLQHYDSFGWKESRDPGANFDTEFYLLHNPDVKAANIDPLAHYLQNGINEARAISPAVGNTMQQGGFDAEYYLFANPDVAAAHIDPLGHYNSNGHNELRNPNGYFDAAGYLANNPDVAAAHVDPYQHYETWGWKENRNPSTSFDTSNYLAANPDVAAAHINPLDHFLTNGIHEGRMPLGDGLWT
ncbi:MAG TPA: CARDB domain-containing protein [Bradyrhizobium sp.]|nr:CARDB domain-containing protein [Bradyrhizobium sp.]